MLALLGLLGVAMTAAVFIEPAAPEEDDTAGDVSSDAGAGSTLPDGETASSFDLLDDPDVSATDDAVTTISGTEGHDRLVGTDNDDHLTGLDGNDRLDGGRGDDWLFGGEGKDELWGHTGDDILTGDAGDDRLNGGDGNDILNGGHGDDTLEGSWGDDTLTGGDGHDLLNAGAGNDILDGRDGDFDYLNGSSGDDLLIAGGGDNLNGGSGADAFRLTDKVGAHIDDFDASEDTIEIEYTDTPPTLTTTTDAQGLTLLADGTAVAKLAGVTELDLAKVALIRV